MEHVPGPALTSTRPLYSFPRPIQADTGATSESGKSCLFSGALLSRPVLLSPYLTFLATCGRQSNDGWIAYNSGRAISSVVHETGIRCGITGFDRRGGLRCETTADSEKDSKTYNNKARLSPSIIIEQS
jgi:hypothetical protein